MKLFRFVRSLAVSLVSGVGVGWCCKMIIAGAGGLWVRRSKKDFNSIIRRFGFKLILTPHFTYCQIFNSNLVCVILRGRKNIFQSHVSLGRGADRRVCWTECCWWIKKKFAKKKKTRKVFSRLISCWNVPPAATLCGKFYCNSKCPKSEKSPFSDSPPPANDLDSEIHGECANLSVVGGLNVCIRSAGRKWTRKAQNVDNGRREIASQFSDRIRM